MQEHLEVKKKRVRQSDRAEDTLDSSKSSAFRADGLVESNNQIKDSLSKETAGKPRRKSTSVELDSDAKLEAANRHKKMDTDKSTAIRKRKYSRKSSPYDSISAKEVPENHNQSNFRKRAKGVRKSHSLEPVTDITLTQPLVAPNSLSLKAEEPAHNSTSPTKLLTDNSTVPVFVMFDSLE